jgi:hypothetical protein
VKVGVVIPSRTEAVSLHRLTHQLLHDPALDHLVIIDNGYANPGAAVPVLGGGRVTVIRDETPSIYHLWNVGYRQAVDRGCDRVVFLNDDVALVGENWLFRLTQPLGPNSDWWATCPDHLGLTRKGAVRSISGTFRQGGMPGYAFAIEASRFDTDPFDERFSWWYGDDVFVRGILDAGGQVGRIGGLHLKHTHSATLDKTDVADAIICDHDLYTRMTR